MQDGLYTLKATDDTGQVATGVAYLSCGHINGGDNWFYWRGIYQVTGDNMLAIVEFHRHAVGAGASNDGVISLHGKVNTNGSASLQGLAQSDCHMLNLTVELIPAP